MAEWLAASQPRYVIPPLLGTCYRFGGKKDVGGVDMEYGKFPKENRAERYFFFKKSFCALRILTPPIKTPDPPNDTPGSSKHVILTPHDIPRILRVDSFSPQSFGEMKKLSMFCFSSGWVVLPPK